MGELIPILIILLTVLIIFFGIIYNKLSKMIAILKEDRRNLVIILDWRRQLIRSLVEELQEEIDIKQTPLQSIINLYQKSKTAKKEKQQLLYMEVENQISNLTENISLLFDQNPKLKENIETVTLEQDIIKIQNELIEVQDLYNNNLDIFNSIKTHFFEAIVIKIVPKLKTNFHYWRTEPQPMSSKEA